MHSKLKIFQFLTLLVYLSHQNQSGFQDQIGEIEPICKQPKDPREYPKTLVLFMIDRSDSKVFNQNIGYIFKLFLCIFIPNYTYFDIIDYSSEADYQKQFPPMKKRGRTEALNRFRHYEQYPESSQNISKIDRIYEALEYFREESNDTCENSVNVLIYIPIITPVMINRSPDWTNFNYLVEKMNILRNTTTSNTKYVALNFFEFDDGFIRFGGLQLGYPKVLPDDVIDQIAGNFVHKFVKPINENYEFPLRFPFIYPEDRVNPTNNSWKCAFCISIGIGTFLLVIFTIFASFYIKNLGKLIENRLMEQGENQKKISEKKSEENVGKIRKKPSKTRKIAAKKRKTILDVDI
ncbi:unnamed protein product [Caenorhabditis angaria]|uniref:VWFA domain-containing protein n=1 Tax=Caenorhabditis angaria TaxID=860376 RepID=A0A9P1N5D3_9PELO|nr:unnamed protein product [Caenorhabditis angaria]